ncbi:hypothetical protein ACFVWG_27020 [Kribbella sp. NPDC058245]|uniref:hypothetical protein n=1 Tax=Kribbella sp. NPDC058245 TaxID=3346399 RepID=UPI0036E16635
MPPADAWNTQLEEDGRVVFPPRRGRVLLRLIAFGALMLLASTNLDHHGSGGTLGPLRVTALAAFVYGTSLSAYQLIKKRPLVIVDGTGVTRVTFDGRTLTWSDIAAIGQPTGLPGARTIQIHPVDRRTRPLRISLDNVEELDAFAHWLRSVQTRYLA